MVDILLQVFNKIKENIDNWSKTEEAKKLLESRNVTTIFPYSENKKVFPIITVEEKTNIFAQGTLSNDEKYSKLMFEINCYDNINPIKRQLTKALAIEVDKTLSIFFGFKRIMCESMPNIDNTQIFRVISRYDGFIDNETKTIYKRI